MNAKKAISLRFSYKTFCIFFSGCIKLFMHNKIF